MSCIQTTHALKCDLWNKCLVLERRGMYVFKYCAEIFCSITSKIVMEWNCVSRERACDHAFLFYKHDSSFCIALFILCRVNQAQRDNTVNSPSSLQMPLWPLIALSDSHTTRSWYNAEGTQSSSSVLNNRTHLLEKEWGHTLFPQGGNMVNQEVLLLGRIFETFRRTGNRWKG
jgi:hypothetical protein